MDVIIRGFMIFAAVELLMIMFYIMNPRLPKLPGDIYFDKSGISVYIPFASSIVISVVLTITLNLIGVKFD